ncbi:NAD-dependent epimerase/dehydratase family protein [Arthrobacter castelli]|uniref:NAD-dependent epimerase/dehydratase family protein n=1 Tax=Arthrobacter castelli TaxID=271431 RepID=UPI000404E966|nr:NAD-dependent epimerase/dehydratase family protein [Arthrobacter castelli]
MRIGIVGATGNIGTALLRRLKRAAAEYDGGVQLVGIARRLPDDSAEPYDGVTWVSHDVASGHHAELVEALKGCDAVVHLAWVLQPNRDEAAMRRINVDGTAHVLAAAADAGVSQVVCATSLGAYSPGPKDRLVDEDWPTGGIGSSHYSRFKGEQETLLDDFEAAHPDITVSRIRQALSFQPDAGSQIARYFIGWLPTPAIHTLRIPLLPFPAEFIFQAVHADDLADAYWRVLDRRSAGAFNIAAEPVLGPHAVATLVGARRWLPIPVPLVRALVDIAWRLRLVALDPGWVDMARQTPPMDTTRARTELGWSPTVDSLSAVRELLEGMGTGRAIDASPSMGPRS